jgi:hypothetical protein
VPKVAIEQYPPPQSKLVKQVSLAVWHAKALPGHAGEMMYSAQSNPAGQVPALQVAGSHRPTGSSHAQISPGLQSESRTQP